MYTFSYLTSDLVSAYKIWDGKAYIETFIHHSIGLFGIISMLNIGRIVGVICSCLMLTEISTIFLNVMFIMKLLEIDEKYSRFNTVNSLMLVTTFFLGRIVFLGCLLIVYIFPAMWNYPYESVA